MELEYFWETEYKFGEFLKRIFGEVYKRKYSLEGNGIYNLLYIDNNIFEVKYKKTTRHSVTKIKDKDDINEYEGSQCSREIKQRILHTIGKNLSTDEVYSSIGEISFPVKNWIAKVEIVRKVKEPK